MENGFINALAEEFCVSHLKQPCLHGLICVPISSTQSFTQLMFTVLNCGEILTSSQPAFTI